VGEELLYHVSRAFSLEGFLAAMWPASELTNLAIAASLEKEGLAGQKPIQDACVGMSRT